MTFPPSKNFTQILGLKKTGRFSDSLPGFCVSTETCEVRLAQNCGFQKLAQNLTTKVHTQLIIKRRMHRFDKKRLIQPKKHA